MDDKLGTILIKMGRMRWFFVIRKGLHKLAEAMTNFHLSNVKQMISIEFREKW